MDFNHAINIPVLKLISGIAEESGVQAYVIGGYVRDLILKRPSKDIDIVVHGSGIELAEKVAAKLGKNKKVQYFKTFGTAMIQSDDLIIEFVGARKESYSSDSRKPAVEDGTLEDDQNRRDFTINALAISLNPSDLGCLIDPFHGMDDLKNKIIRTPLEPGITFSDDPLRMMRAIRFATQLDFTIEENCLQAIRDFAPRIGIVSMERVTDELNKILSSLKPSVGLRLLSESGLLKLIFPEFEALRGVDVVENLGHKDNFDHTLQVVDRISLKSDNLWLRWAALLHDTAKPVTKKFIEGTGWTFHGHEIRGGRMALSIFRQLRLPMNEKLKYVRKLISLHLRPASLTEEGVTDSAVRRLLYDAGEAIDDLMMLAEADITSKNHKKVKLYLQNFELLREKILEVEKKDKLRNWQPPVSGEVIMETFGIIPCREVGIIKTAIREAILEGVIPNNYEEAFEFMIKEGKKLGLQKKIK
jgi:poly(A) polymerase